MKIEGRKGEQKKIKEERNEIKKRIIGRRI